MADTDEFVSLIVDGKELRGFQEVQITRSSENAAISFALQCTNPSWSDDAWALKAGAAVELKTSRGGRGGGELLVKGYIDEYEASYGEGDSKDVRISGRSKSADMIDCPPAKHKTGRIEKKNLKDAAAEFDEFDVGIKSDVPLRVIDKIQRDPRETAFQTIERYARSEGLLLIGEPDGSINITRAGKKRHGGQLLVGARPILKISVKFSAKDKKTPVVSRSQSGLGADSKALRKEEKIYDESVGRYRPALVFPEREAAEAEVKRRADWKRLRAHGTGVSATIDVAGWRDDGGKLWSPGWLVAVKHEAERLDQDLSISTVTYRQTAKATQSTTTLIEPKAQGGKGSAGKSDKAWDTKEGDL